MNINGYCADFTHVSSGKYHRIDKMMKIQEVNSEVMSSSNCVFWHPCYVLCQLSTGLGIDV